MHACMHLCVCCCMHACTYTHRTCTRTHKHTHTHTDSFSVPIHLCLSTCLPICYLSTYPPTRPCVRPTSLRPAFIMSVCLSVTRPGDCHQYGDVAPRLKNHYSVDSLVTADVSGSTSDLDTCFKAQCNQIFIGMITMQYQAKQAGVLDCP